MLPRAGVRYQVAPSKRSSRACSTPAVSAPASGCPPMKRWSAPAAPSSALGRADVADHAVGARRVERLGDEPREHARRARRRTRSRRRRPPPRRPRHRGRSRPARARRSARRDRGRSRVTRRPARRRAARPIEPPISPTPRTATFKGPAPRRGPSDRAEAPCPRAPRRPPPRSRTRRTCPPAAPGDRRRRLVRDRGAPRR